MLPILLQDANFVVLNKPAGLPVHAGPRGGPSVEDWFPELSRRRAGPWLAHRLDTDTSGCLVVALRRAALHQAQAAFAGGHADKVYWAVVHGTPDAASGTIDQPLAKRNDINGWRMVTDPAGERAVTAWRVMGSADGLTWLSLRPRTGRTHQVRVHCTALGLPIVGDPVYGHGQGVMQLLARSIHLPIKDEITAFAPVPPHMVDAMRRCGITPHLERGMVELRGIEPLTS